MHSYFLERWLSQRLRPNKKSPGFPSGSDIRESACNARDPSLIPVSGRSPGEGNGNPHQYSCLENSMDGGVWQTLVHGITKSQTQLNDKPFLARRKNMEAEEML